MQMSLLKMHQYAGGARVKSSENLNSLSSDDLSQNGQMVRCNGWIEKVLFVKELTFSQQAKGFLPWKTVSVNLRCSDEFSGGETYKLRHVVNIAEIR